MVEVIWSTRSIKDIDQTAEFISKNSYAYAVSFVERIFKLENVIKSNPYIGRIVPEFNKKNLREIITGNYRVVYQTTNFPRIEILSVHHGARLLKKKNLK